MSSKPKEVTPIARSLTSHFFMSLALTQNSVGLA